MEKEDLRLLIVDDDELIRNSLSLMFSNSFDVEIASCAKEAIKILETSSPFQLILSDYRMPGMLGSDFLAYVYENYPETVRILLTGYTDQENLVKAINSGHIYAYVTKPWKIEELSLIVAKAAEHYQLSWKNQKLTENLKLLNQQLLDSNTNLEQRVRERTEELNEKNIQLQNSLINLEKSKLELKEANNRLTRFVSIVSHDLRTPIGNIISLTEVLNETALEENQELINYIKDSARLSFNLVKDILDMSSIERGKLKLNFSPNELTELVRRAVDNVLYLAKRKKVKLENKVTEKCLVHVDSDRICQVLHNLLSNSVKFCNENDKITINAYHNCAGIKIEVTDTGIGIEKENLEKIFDQYEKFSTFGTQHEQGTGLGLPISQEIIRAHFSTISVQSEPGKGSVFSFFIPYFKKSLNS